MKIGFSRHNINPTWPLELWGFAKRHGKSDGILSDLYVRVLTVSGENTSLVIISLDVGAIGGDFADHIKEDISKKIKIDKNNIIISTTHTHSAPALIKLRNAGIPDERYMNMIQSIIRKTVVKANKDQIPAKFGYGFGKLDFGVNRRENEIRSDLLQNSGLIDPDVSVVRIDNLEDIPLVVLFNYAVHPVTLYADNIKVSADYPGEACKYIENNLNCEAMFLQGTCANINPKIFGDFEKTKTIGKALGSEVIRVAEEVETHEISSFEFTPHRVKLPIEKPPSIDEITEIISRHENFYSAEPTIFEETELEWALDLYSILNKNPKVIPQYVDQSVGILKLNDLSILFLAGEIFVETGLKIKEILSPQKIIVVGYTDDCSLGYLPTEEAYKEGDYEVEQAYKYYGLFRYAMNAEQILISEIVRFAKK